MNDETPTIEQPPSEEGPGRKAGDGRPRRLLRSAGDRMIVGVAGGLGRYFGVDPVIFRIGFALSVFFGGIGALAYLLLAVFVETDGEPDALERFGRRLRAMGLWRTLGLAAIGIVALAGLVTLAGAAAFAVGLGWGVPTAIVVIAAGGLLIGAAFRGGARWLIPPAVALAIGGGVAAAADLDLRGGVGERQYHPASVRAIPSDGYRLGVGRLVVDLRDLDWGRHRVVHLDVSLGMGQLNVFVPKRVCVSGSTHAGMGESEVAGEQNDGVDVDHSTGIGSTATPRLDIDAHVDMGQLRIINSDTAEVDTRGYGPGPFHQDTGPLRAAEARACAAG